MDIKNVGQNTSVQGVTLEDHNNQGQVDGLRFRPGQGAEPRVGSGHGLLDRIDMAFSRTLVSEGQSTQVNGDLFSKLRASTLQEAGKLLQALDDSGMDPKSPGVSKAMDSYAKAVVDELRPRLQGYLRLDHCEATMVLVLLRAIENLGDPARSQKFDAFFRNDDNSVSVLEPIIQRMESLLAK